jgi:hypothetical protein
MASPPSPGCRFSRSHQRSLAPRIYKKEVEQRPHLGQLAKLQHARSALFHCHHQRHRRGIHLLLHMDLLRHAIVFHNEVALLQPINHMALFLHQRGHQHFGCGGFDRRRRSLLRGHRLGRLNGRQLL